MSLKSRFWADLSTADFAALDPARTVAVLPLGATEQHGPHLPLQVDTCLADAIIAAALAQVPADVPVLVLPTQSVGYSPEHGRFAGTLTLSAQTVIALWTEIGQCVARSGVRKLLLFNAHGGHVAVMDMVGRELRSRCDLIVYSCNWWNLPLGEAAGAFDAREHRFGVHAGALETSMMLALRPDTVDMSVARDFGSASEGRARDYPLLGNGTSARLSWHMQDYNPQGAAGHAAGATATAGQALLDAASAQLARLLQELAALPLSTLSDRPPLD